MKKLTDTFRLRGSRYRIHFRKSHPDKTGGRRQITGQSHSSHATAVRLQQKLLRETVHRLVRRQIAVIIQPEQLLVKGWIVRQYSYGIIIDVQPLPDCLYRDRLVPVRQDPVQL